MRPGIHVTSVVRVWLATPAGRRLTGSEASAAAGHVYELDTKPPCVFTNDQPSSQFTLPKAPLKVTLVKKESAPADADTSSTSWNAAPPHTGLGSSGNVADSPPLSSNRLQRLCADMISGSVCTAVNVATELGHLPVSVLLTLDALTNDSCCVIT